MLLIRRMLLVRSAVKSSRRLPIVTSLFASSARGIARPFATKTAPWEPVPGMMDAKSKLGMLREMMSAKRLDA